MSTSRGSGNGVQPIPAGSKKMVMSLKEIVSCSEAEIYATLKECNMDPNEAVNRLLSQDPFCEVKSKREKKKEFKDTTDSRPRGGAHSSNRGVKSGGDRYLGRGGSAPYKYSDPAPLHGKSTYKKENGSAPYSSSFSSPAGMSETTRGRGPSGLSDDSSAENKGSSLGTAGGISSGSQPPVAQHSAWVGVPGQVSMADIVKMGRPRGPPASASQHNSSLPEGHASKNHESQVPLTQREEWPSIEKPPPSKVTSIPDYTDDSKVHPQASGGPLDSVNQDSDYEEDKDTEDDENENTGADEMGSLSISSRKISDDDLKGASSFENDYNDRGSYQQQAHDFEHHEVEEAGASVESVTNNLQQLGMEKDGGGLPSDSDAPSVVIPNHLQVQTADCSHLSFGSFGSGMNLPYSSGTTASLPVKSNLEQPESEADFSSVEHPDSRNSEYYVGDSLTTSDGNLYHRTSANAGSYDTSSASQPEELKPENADVAHGNQYPFPSSNGYNFDDAQRLNGDFSQTSSEMQNLAPFSNVMQSYPNSLQGALLAANVEPSRESELQYFPFPATQSMSAKYGNTISSIGGSTISMSEALKTAGLSSAQPTAQTPSGTSVATGPPLPQHLAMHPYSQPTLPLGPYANMISYPFMPQSYPYMNPAFQQALAGNTAYHQSLTAAGLPQYKSSVSVSSLPQSAAIASGYGGAFGNTSAIPGNFPLNPPAAAAAPSGTTLSYEDLLNSQYKDHSQLLSLQQNENAAMWLHGANSRTMSAVPASSYYNYQTQNQQPGGFRQAQQPSQNYGTLGYPNFYHSQAGMSSLDQPQNPRDGSLGGPQGQAKQSQIWQNSY